MFSDLPYLTYLDLSHNKQLILETRGRTFRGLEDVLLFLGMTNISLLSVRTKLVFVKKDLFERSVLLEKSKKLFESFETN